ncbi:MAG: cytochrome C biogenesis protein [Gammaproteobacteria bacterium]|nr:MAG: cytochrome C biogenesis protein [Gammaproteobacteria bacterium]
MQTLHLAGESTYEDERDEALLERRHQTMGVATLALLLHGWVVFRALGLPAHLHLPFFTSLNAVSMAVVLLHIAICLRQPATYLGIAIYPLASFSLIAWLLFGDDTSLEPAGQHIEVHVFLSLLSYAMLTLAALQSGLVAIQRHLLKDHQAGGLVRALPALDRTEELLFTLLTVGFVLLTFALGTGFLILDNMFAQHVVHKTFLSSAAWLIFGIILLGRWRFGWRGNRALIFIFAGSAVLVLAFFGSKFVFEILLDRGG